MPLKIQLSIAFGLAIGLAGCATTESVPHNAALLEKPQSHSGHKSHCGQASAAPSIKCSDTVTATSDANGMLWIAWVDGGHVYLQALTDNGQHFSEPMMVNAEPEAIAARGENRPKLKLDKEGNIFLTWTQSLEKRHTGNIRFSRSTDGGKSFSTPMTINDNLDIIGHSFDSLEIGKNGEIFIAWLDARDKVRAKVGNEEFRGSSLYYTWSGDGGKSFQPNRIVAPHSCECCRLATAIDVDNLPVVMWRQVFEGGIRDHASIKFIDWNTPGAIRRASQENWKIDACPHHGPALSISEAGIYHAVWFSGEGEQPGLYYAYSSDAGLTYSPVYRFGRQGKHPTVSAMGQNVAIAWSEYDGTDNQLMLIESKDAGKTWSAPIQLGKTRDSSDDAFLLNDGENFYVSWQTKQGYRIEAIAFE